MTAIDTRQLMALMTIAQHHGRPGTPTDQAHIESFFSHLKGDWPDLVTITDPPRSTHSSPGSRPSTTRSACTPRSGTSPPTNEHHGRGLAIRRARAAGIGRARAERIKHNRASKR
jgi:putative transposase